MNFPVETACCVSFADCCCFSHVKYCATFIGSVDGERPLGSEFWPQTGQPQQWSTPRSPLGLTGPPPTTLQGMSADDWQSPLPPPPTRDANNPGFGCGDSGRQDASLTGWNATGKGYKGGVMPFVKFSDRDPIPKWNFQEPGARLRPWLRELSFWRHDTSSPVNQTRCQIVQVIALRNDWSEFGQIHFQRIKFVRVKDLI